MFRGHFWNRDPIPLEIDRFSGLVSIRYTKVVEGNGFLLFFCGLLDGFTGRIDIRRDAVIEISQGQGRCGSGSFLVRGRNNSKDGFSATLQPIEIGTTENWFKESADLGFTRHILR